MVIRALIILFALQAPAYAKDFYGERPTMSVKSAKSLDDVVATFDKVKGPVLVKGKVEKVCEKKGCWLKLAGLKNKVRVTFKGYSFFVPKTLIGKDVFVQGILEKKVESVADQKHYLKDAGASEKEILAVNEAKQSWHFVASGVAATL